MEVHQQECQKLIESCYKNTNITATLFAQKSTDMCLLASKVCNALVVQPILSDKKLNMYDIRKPCQSKVATKKLGNGQKLTHTHLPSF